MSNNLFSPAGFGKGLTLSVTTSNTQGTLKYPDASASGSALLVNAGTATVFVRWGTSAQTATTSDIPVLSGQTLPVSTGGAQYFAAITGSGTATLYVVPGNGG